MASIKIAVVNASQLLKDVDITPVVNALQIQVHRDFAPIWGIDADLRVIPQTSALNPSEWLLAILDNSDQAGALGYHDVTKDGFPLGKIFAATDKQYKENWTVTASHELLEMLADPSINLTMFAESPQGGGTLYAYEVCDACESENFQYDINGVKVSDFVFPTWFETFRTSGSVKFDHKGTIEKPLQLLKGGYIGIYNVSQGSGWTQLTAEKENFRARPPVGSRRERRTIPLSERLRSTAQ